MKQEFLEFKGIKFESYDSPEICDKWETFLEKIRLAVRNLSRTEKREVWLHQKFQEANSKSRNETLSHEETRTLLESVGFDMKKRGIPLFLTRAKGELEYDEVSRIYNFMIVAEDVRNLFNEVSSDKK